MRILLFITCSAAAGGPAFAQAPVEAPAPSSTPAQERVLTATTLRDSVRADGPALRLGDVFHIEGPAAAREIAPAPRAGEAGLYSTAFLAAAARAAGFSWVPQPGFIQLSIEGPRAGEGQRPASHFATPVRSLAGPDAPAAAPAAAPVIKRGEQINLIYTQGALRVSTRARALNGAGQGEAVRVLTLPAERQLEAKVTGPGEATVSQ